MGCQTTSAHCQSAWGSLGASAGAAVRSALMSRAVLGWLQAGAVSCPIPAMRPLVKLPQHLVTAGTGNMFC